MGARESLTQATVVEAKDASRGCNLREPERLDDRSGWHPLLWFEWLPLKFGSQGRSIEG